MGGDGGSRVERGKAMGEKSVCVCRDLPECYTSGAAWLRRRTKSRLHLCIDNTRERENNEHFFSFREKNIIKRVWWQREREKQVDGKFNT